MLGLNGVGGTVIYEVYRVGAGETLEDIAAKYGVSVEELRAVNRWLVGEVQENQFLTVPVKRREVVDRRVGTNVSRRRRVWQSKEGQAGIGARGDVYRVGRLGVVRAEGVPIVRHPGGKEIVYRCERGMELVIVGERGEWLGVMMVDGSQCWIRKSAVRVSGIELVAGIGQREGGRREVVREALSYLGTPYKYGGEGRGGIDCSALIQRAFKAVGIKLPRTAGEQYKVGRIVRWGELKSGDRLYFASKGGGIDHAGIYIGGGKFVHASGRHGAVVVSDLRDPYYWGIFVGAKR